MCFVVFMVVCLSLFQCSTFERLNVCSLTCGRLTVWSLNVKHVESLNARTPERVTFECLSFYNFKFERLNIERLDVWKLDGRKGEIWRLDVWHLKTRSVRSWNCEVWTLDSLNVERLDVWEFEVTTCVRVDVFFMFDSMSVWTFGHLKFERSNV